MRWQRIAMGLAAGTLACGGAERPPEEPESHISWGEAVPDAAQATEGNRAPEITSVRLEPEEPLPGQALRAAVQASDADGDALELEFVWTESGLQRPESGPQIQLGELAPGERVEVTVVASDGRAQSSPASTWAAVRNRRPVITRLTMHPGAEVPRGEPVSVVVDAEDPDGGSLEYRYAWRVNGRRLTAAGPSLETKLLKSGDSIVVEVVAEDGRDESDPIVSAPVVVANAFPLILSSPGDVSEDGVFRYTIEARDPDGDRNLRYYLKSGPEGMTVNPVLGEVRWQPAAVQAGAHVVEVAVEDSAGARTVQAFELEVAVENPAEESPPAAPER